MRSGRAAAARHITGKYGEISGCRVISAVKNSADSRKRQAATAVCLRPSNALHFNGEPPVPERSQRQARSVTGQPVTHNNLIAAGLLMQKVVCGEAAQPGHQHFVVEKQGRNIQIMRPKPGSHYDIADLNTRTETARHAGEHNKVSVKSFN